MPANQKRSVVVSPSVSLKGENAFAIDFQDDGKSQGTVNLLENSGNEHRLAHVLRLWLYGTHFESIKNFLR